MAFSHVADVGTANSKSSGTTLSMSPSQDIEVGQIAILFAAFDSFSDGIGGGGCNRLAKASDSAGNVWVSLSCNSGNSADIEAGSAIFISVVTNEISTSDTITLTLRIAKTAKVIAVSVFEMDVETYVWGMARPSGTTSTTGSQDPAAISVGGLDSNVEHLLLHVLAAEGPNTDAYTWDSSYTQITGDGTTGGADDSNMHLRGGWRIVSGITGDTVDVTSDTANRDYHQGLVALVEVQAPYGFPNIPLRDDFDRANENPMTGVSPYTWDTSLRPDSSYLQLTSNQAANGNGFSGGSFNNPSLTTSSTTCLEAYATIGALGAASAAIIGVCIDASGDANINVNQSGRILEWSRAGDPGNGGPGGRAAVDDCIQYGYIGPGGGPHTDGQQVRYRIWLDAAAGYRLGLQRIGEAVHAFYDIGNGWTWGACYADEGTSSATRRFSLHVYSSSKAEDFHAGEIACWQPEFIRRPWRYQGKALELLP